MWKENALPVALVLALFAFLFFVIPPNTFESRCKRAYPNSGLEQERCVWRLSKGLMP